MKSKTMKFALLALMALLVGMGARTVQATTFLQLQSTYLGDGWFQYQMNVLDDPFFTEAAIYQLSINFTNEVDSSTGSTNWVDTGSGWSATNGFPARPYEVTFLMQSSETSYKLETNSYAGAAVAMGLEFADFYPGFSGTASVLGIAPMPCLIPCTPDEADDSPTNFVYALKLIPDVSINQLIQTNGSIYGVDFTWGYDSTFLLQGTTDLVNWTNVTYIWSTPPETLWTTNQSLNNFGNYFRVELVADGYVTNLPPLDSAASLTPKTVAKVNASATTPSVTSCQLSGGQILVHVATQAGQKVQVQATNSHGIAQQTQQVLAQGSSATVSFNAAGLPSPVFFQATAVP